MESRWDDAEADRCVERYAARWGEPLALRVYTSRLIGGDPALVLHGGGNTSLKGRYQTLLGDEIEALWVKGSGSDLDRIEPAGFPALDLAYLRRLRTLEALTDAEMVNQLRTHLFEAGAPNPSVETLLHAFLPHPWIDHSHADAILALTNQPSGEALVREALGPGIGIVPYAMPGLRLAKLAATVYEQDPKVEALVLLHHGLFTFADDARTSYERTIRYVDLAERFLARPRPRAAGSTVADAPFGNVSERWAERAPIVRNVLAEPSGDPDRPWRRVILEFRSDVEILTLLADPTCARLATEGPLTVDHVIRTKACPLFLGRPTSDDPADFRGQLGAAVVAYRAAYDAYFEHQSGSVDRPLTKLSSNPTVLLLPGLGLVGVGASAQEAAIAADIAEHTLKVKAQAESVGRYTGLAEADLFEVEYWSLEQAKLGRASSASLAGQVALVTGGGGAIGVGVAEQLLAAGAHVALTDIDPGALDRARERLVGHRPERLLTVPCDVTDETAVDRAVAAVCRRFGGLDLCVVNAGVAHVAPLVDLTAEDFRRVQEVNAAGAFLTLRAAARVMIRQATGGNIVVVSSKNVFAPGAAFGAYSVSKAAAHQLGKIAALELAEHAIRVNMLNPDAVFGDAATPSGLWREVGPDRARSKGIEPSELAEYYRGRNLLKADVRATHVGNAVVFFASNQTPTTGASLPIDGGLAEAFPR